MGCESTAKTAPQSWPIRRSHVQMTVATIASALKDEIAEATSDAQAKRLLRFAADGRRKKIAIHASAEAPMPRHQEA